jgi:hypothetical protein
MTDAPKEKPTEKATATFEGTVDKIIPALPDHSPEKAQISIEGAEDLYREIRIENALQDKSGKSVGLKQGAEVDVTIAADPNATTEK